MPETGNLAPNRLVLLVTVVNKGKGTFFADLLQNYEVNLQMSFVGRGTAQSDLLEFLGMKDDRRSILFSVLRAELADTVLAELQERFRTVNSGTGIAFTVPMSSMIGTLAYGFLSNDKRTVKEEA